MREHFEQAEKEVLTFRPSLATGNRPRSPSPQRGKSQHHPPQQQQDSISGHSEENGEVDNTPLKPIYNFGQETPEKVTTIDIIAPSSPEVR